MAISIRLPQSKFKEANRGGKWHARVVSNGETSTSDLAAAIQSNTSFTRGEVTGIIMALVDEISYNLSLGNTVVLDGLGRFHLTVESDPVENKEDFDIKKNVKGVKCKFLPASRRDPKTRKSTQDFASGVQVVWADPEDEEE